MPAVSTDKFSQSSNGGIPAVATVTANRATGVNSLSVDTQQYWPTNTGIKFQTYRLDANNKVITGTLTDWRGVSNGSNQLTNISPTGGDHNAPLDVGNLLGDKVVMAPTAQWGEDLIEGIMTQHNQDGTHGNVTASNVSTNTLNVASNVVLPNGSTSSTVLKNPYKFSAYFQSGVASYTTGSIKPVLFDSEYFDTGNNFSTTNGTFVAPVAGFYQFNANIQFNNGGNVGYFATWWIVGNTNYHAFESSASPSSAVSCAAMSRMFQLTAGQSVQVGVTSNQSWGISGTNSTSDTSFSGFLVSTV